MKISKRLRYIRNYILHCQIVKITQHLFIFFILKNSTYFKEICKIIYNNIKWYILRALNIFSKYILFFLNFQVISWCTKLFASTRDTMRLTAWRALTGNVSYIKKKKKCIWHKKIIPLRKGRIIIAQIN